MRSSIERLNRLLLFYVERENYESGFVVNNLRIFSKKSEILPRLERKELVQAKMHYLLLQKARVLNRLGSYCRNSLMN